MVLVALAVTVLISTYRVCVKTMWRQAPITAAIVIAAGLAGASTAVGVQRGLHRVAEGLFGSLVGMLVSWIMSRVGLVRCPEERARTGRRIRPSVANRLTSARRRRVCYAFCRPVYDANHFCREL
jgi:hypothetical protein